MIPGFSFAFEGSFGLDSAPPPLREPFVNPRGLVGSLGFTPGASEGPTNGMDRDTCIIRSFFER
jgi:hypothetical protein